MSAYLDHAATTPLRPEAREAWLAAHESCGNASSIHGHGQAARRALEEARERVAAAIDADPVEVVFTSGGTESVNLALRGLWQAREHGVEAIVVPSAEHHAVLDTAAALANEGAELRFVPVDADASLVLHEWREALGRPGAALATLLVANNETGTVQPLRDAVDAATDAGVPLHLDAIGAFGQLPLSFRELRAHDAGSRGGARAGGLVALSLAGHKLGAPVGTGALIVAREARLKPLLHGGGQQRGIRPGTQDVAGAVAFAVAAELAVAERAAEHTRRQALRERLEAGVRAIDPTVRVSAADAPRLPGHLHLVFDGAQGDGILMLLDAAGISVSTGSACQAGTPEPSHVVLAMGLGADAARSAIRLTLGRTSTADDVDALLRALPGALERARRAGLSSRTRS